MKKLILMFVMVVGLSTGCERSLSVSSKPTFFIIEKITQDKWDKQANVTQYKLQIWATTSGGLLSHLEDHWYTLQEGFQVGDTLKFIKK
jgi:hypothetical protein